MQHNKISRLYREELDRQGITLDMDWVGPIYQFASKWQDSSSSYIGGAIMADIIRWLPSRKSCSEDRLVTAIHTKVKELNASLLAAETVHLTIRGTLIPSHFGGSDDPAKLNLTISKVL